MKPWSEIREALKQKIPQELIEPADSRAGIFGDWLRGSVAIGLANNVFGADGWHSKVVVPPQIVERVVQHTKGREDGAVLERPGIIVTCVMEITAYGLDESGVPDAIVRQDVGWGTASGSWDGKLGYYAPLKPAQIRAAYMGSVTIGIKRCLHQIGEHLGLQLYIPDEDHMAALGWEAVPETAGQEPVEETQQRPPAPKAREPAPRAAEESPPPPKAGPPKVPPSTTVEGLAKELKVEITDSNSATLVDLAAKRLKATKLGQTNVGTKKVTETLGAACSISRVYAEMPSYAVWMASEGSTTPQSGQAFKDMLVYDQLMRLCADLAYLLRGGEYEPWEGAGIHDPGVMVGFLIEQAACKSLDEALIARFPSDSGDGINPYRFKNHLKGHFQVERVGLLTWEQLAYFRAHVVNGADYPPQWAGKKKAEIAAKEPAAKGEEVADEKDTKPIDFGPGSTEEPEKEPDYAGDAAKMLEEIGNTVEPNEGILAIAKKYPLTSKSEYDVVRTIYLSVQAGHLRKATAVQTLLETALKGLAG